MYWKRHWLMLLLVSMLLGCETFDDGPVDVICTASCTDCAEVELTCEGTGRDRSTKKTKTPIGG
jgi:hypothetical protein